MYHVTAYRTDRYHKNPIIDRWFRDRGEADKAVANALASGQVKVIVRCLWSRFMRAYNRHKTKTRNGNLIITRLVYTQETGKERQYK